MTSKDPYCNYLFLNDPDKAMLLLKHDQDIETFYSKRTRYKPDKFYSGEALLAILKTVFTHKKFLKLIKADDENGEFYSSNCKLLENEIESEYFNGEQTFALITNYMAIINRNVCKSETEEKSRRNDFHLNSPEIVQKIRKIFGLKWRSLENMKSHYLVAKLFSGLILLIFILLTAIIALCLVDIYRVVDFSKNMTILAPLVTKFEAGILNFTALLGAGDLYQSSLMIIIGSFLLLLLLAFTIFSVIRIWKTEKLEYEVHYLSRIIGESSQKLREIGWL